MSSTGYDSPPIQEALCEVRFEDGSWDLRWAGQISERLGATYDGELREVRALQAEISAGPGGAPSVATHDSLQKLQLWSKAEDRVLALGPGLLSVSVIGDYPGWDAFRPLIHEAVEAVSLVTGWSLPSRAGVRYINRISVPEEETPYSDLLKVPIPQGGSIPGDLAGFFSRYEYVRDDHVRLLVTAGSLTPEPPELRAYLLDVDTIHDGKTLAGLAALFDVIDDLRAFERSVFEDLVGPGARNLFGER